ncbi:adenosine receptor A2b-like [Glandiceps talaboti]
MEGSGSPTNDTFVEWSGVPSIQITGETLYFVICLAFVACCVLGGNALVLISVVVNENLQSVEHYFIVSLSVADFLVGISWPYCAIPLINPFLFDGFYQCLLAYTFFPILVNASIYQLLMISIDRYLSITRPFWHTQFMTPLRYKLCIVLVWIVAITQSLVMWTWLGVEERYFGYCTLPTVWQENSKTLLFYLWIGWAIPTFLVVVVYLLVFCVAYKQARRTVPIIGTIDTSLGDQTGTTGTTITSEVKQLRLESCSENNDDIRGHETIDIGASHSNQSTTGNTREEMFECGTAPGPSSAETVQSSTRNTKSCETGQGDVIRHKSKNTGKKFPIFNRNMKAVITLGIIVGVFLICWLPYQIITAITVLCSPHQCVITRIFRNYLAMLVNANSGINPLIYAYRVKEFRKTFKQILRAIFCRKQTI